MIEKTCATCVYGYPCKDTQNEGDLRCGNSKSKEYGYSNYPGTVCDEWYRNGEKQ